jgi:hypothetical protein
MAPVFGGLARRAARGIVSEECGLRCGGWMETNGAGFNTQLMHPSFPAQGRG